TSNRSTGFPLSRSGETTPDLRQSARDDRPRGEDRGASIRPSAWRQLDGAPRGRSARAGGRARGRERRGAVGAAVLCWPRAGREALLRTPPERVICTVSGPQEEGRMFAHELRKEGLQVELVDDAVAPAQLEWATLLLLGADTVYRYGTLCNKPGTRDLAEAAA